MRSRVSASSARISRASAPWAIAGRLTLGGMYWVIRSAKPRRRSPAAAVGRELAERILDDGGRAILAEVYKNSGPS